MRIGTNWSSIQIERGVRQMWVFTLDLLNLVSETNVRELVDPLGLIIGEHNLHNITYTDDSVEGRVRRKTGKTPRHGSKGKWAERMTTVKRQNV